MPHHHHTYIHGLSSKILCSTRLYIVLPIPLPPKIKAFASYTLDKKGLQFTYLKEYNKNCKPSKKCLFIKILHRILQKVWGQTEGLYSNLLQAGFSKNRPWHSLGCEMFISEKPLQKEGGKRGLYKKRSQIQGRILWRYITCQSCLRSNQNVWTFITSVLLG